MDTETKRDSGKMNKACSFHGAFEEKMKQQERNYSILSDSITNLQNALFDEMGKQNLNLLDEMSKLNLKVETIHTKLVGDLDSDDSPGFIQKVTALETESITFRKNQDDLQKTISKMVPWFSVFKWTVITVAPVFIIGFITLVTGLLTGNIKIIM